jgi:polar amino acid transport system substrate-binding protein
VCLLSLAFLVSRALMAYFCLRFLGIEASDLRHVLEAERLRGGVVPSPGGARSFPCLPGGDMLPTMSLRLAALLLIPGLLVAPVAAAAPGPAKTPRIGLLGDFPTNPHYEAFRQGLHELGYVEGQSIAIERRYSEGRVDRLPDLATALVRLKLDLIVVDGCGAPLNAATQATRTIPLVVAACNDDLVATGLIVSLARPGGNVTGVSEFGPEVGAKRLELLRETLPKVKRVGVLWNPAYAERFSPAFRFWTPDWIELREAARLLGMRLQSVEIGGPDDLPAAFSTMLNEKNEWVGFSIDLLEAIRARLEKKLGKPIKLEKKEITPTTRIALVANRAIDVECGSTTYTRGRDETVDFSINFFFTGSQLLVKKGSGIRSLADVAGKRVGAVRETTNEKALRASQPRAEVVTFHDDAAAFLALEHGRIVAFVSDGIRLAAIAAKARTPEDYEVVGDFFSKDPYSCMVPENDSRWRDFVNHTIMELIDSGKFFELYDKWFGERGVVSYPMTPRVRDYLLMQSAPE